MVAASEDLGVFWAAQILPQSPSSADLALCVSLLAQSGCSSATTTLAWSVYAQGGPSQQIRCKGP